jgi:hypothetical protein
MNCSFCLKALTKGFHPEQHHDHCPMVYKSDPEGFQVAVNRWIHGVTDKSGGPCNNDPVYMLGYNFVPVYCDISSDFKSSPDGTRRHGGMISDAELLYVNPRVR